MRAATPPAARGWFMRRLRSALRGSVRIGPASWPVVVPADEADLQITVEAAAQEGLPVAVRGAGQGSPGAADVRALVVDCRQLSLVLDFDAQQGRIEAQAGLSVAGLEALLAPHGWQLAVDRSVPGAATLGGLVGVDPGVRVPGGALLSSRLEAVEAVLVDGTVQRFGPFGVRDTTPLEGTRASSLVSGLFDLAVREHATLARIWPTELVPALGFRFAALGGLPGVAGDPGSAVNLARALAGSRGQLAISRRLRLRLDPRPAHRRWLAFSAASFADALQCLGELAAHAPLLAEAHDASTLASSTGAAVRALFDADPSAGALVLAEFGGDEARALERVLARASLACAGARLRALRTPAVASDAAGLGPIETFRATRLQPPPGPPATIVPEDNLLPVAGLADAWQRIDALLAARRLRVRWSAELGPVRLSLRPLDAASARALVRDGALAAQLGQVVRDAGGGIDGLRLDPAARAALLALQFGEEGARLSAQARALFDPQRRLVSFVATAATEG